MEKEFIPYEQALALKELGFDEPCMMNHYGDERLHVGRLYLPTSFGKGKNSEMHDDSLRDGDVTAVLYQQAFRWFREKHNLFGLVFYHTDNRIVFEHPHYFRIYEMKYKGKQIEHSKEYKTYEEAELECLKKLIKIVKSEKNIN